MPPGANGNLVAAADTLRWPLTLAAGRGAADSGKVDNSRQQGKPAMVDTELRAPLTYQLPRITRHDV